MTWAILACAAVLIALIGVFVAWRVMSEVGKALTAFSDVTGNALGAIRSELCEIREHQKESVQRMAVLDAKWSTAHRLVEKVVQLEERVETCESLLKDTYGAEFEARRAHHDSDGEEEPT